MGIRENLSSINERISQACGKCGRNTSSVRLIAVSKTKPLSDILEAASAGQMVFGENYAQELRDKSKELSEYLRTHALTHSRTDLEWHFIGHLQRNKLKYVLPVAKWIHTVDSVELLEEIEKKLATSNQQPATINCLIEVNIAKETTKSGILPENIFGLVERFSTYALTHPRTHALRGLMCMPPVSDDPETSRPYFKNLKNLLDEINSRNIYPEKLTELSMGMTQDFEVAIEEGATMVRIGSAIFGERASGFASVSKRGMGGRSEV